MSLRGARSSDEAISAQPYESLMENIARYLIIGGIILILIGGGVYLAAKLGIPFGRLPGDIRIEGENGSFYFPVVTSLLVSIILTVVLNLIFRLFK
jgi:hypothetical protein